MDENNTEKEQFIESLKSELRGIQHLKETDPEEYIRKVKEFNLSLKEFNESVRDLLEFTKQ